MKTYLKLFYLPLIVLLFAGCKKQSLNEEDFLTYYEKNDFNHTPGYAETIEYCKLLVNHSAKINYTTIGISPQGREIPLLIVDKDGMTTPEGIRKTGRLIVLAEACIHAGEPDGKDAGLMFIRDIGLYNKYESILDNVSFLFIPILNVDGHEDFGEHYRINQNGPVEVGARFTAQRFNMNRDFIKADAPETRAFLKLYSQWIPELFIDVHVTNGADFQYVSTYGLDQCGYLAPNMLIWSKNVFEKELNAKMKESGYPIFPYFTMLNIPDFGIGILPDVFPPQYSNGYAAANNRIGLLIENHIYKPYKERVNATYLYFKHSLEIIGQNNKTLAQKVKIADQYIASPEFRRDSFPLMYKHDMKESINTDYLAWKDTTVISDLSGGKWTYYNYSTPVTIQYPLFTSYKEDVKIKLSEAYIIPQEQLETIELLDIHGVFYERLDKDSIIEVETYHFTEAEWAKIPYEGRVTLITKYITLQEKVKYHAGDVIVPSSQPKIKIVANMLEPKSPTSLVYWGFYNNFIKAPNEFWIRLSYMEVKGREMLDKDPALKSEFEEKKKNDPSFAKDPNAILNFFMSKIRESVEIGVNRYPIGRIM
ncbi:MAG: hypothetical protein LBL90_10835 [Prevotellaceae bacterium]|jgi:hypothetical protein|nr:hypothetical protein [Prevotellaceae bacterium]